VTSVLAFLAVVLASCLIALAIAWIVDRVRERHDHTPDDDRVGVKIGAAFAVYGVILGFAVVVAQQSYADSEAAVRSEMGAVISTVNVASALPPSQGGPIVADMRTYLEAEIASWDALGDAQINSTSLTAIRQAYVDTEALTAAPSAAVPQAAIFANLAAVDAGRADRILLFHARFSPFMWALLLGGGLLVIAMMSLLHFDSKLLRVCLLLAMASLIGVALFTTWAFSQPFSGPISISPGALQHVLSSL
jgi:hypothetical protein